MLTRKHPHARDLLRRWRKEFIYRPTTPRTILAEIMEGRRHHFRMSVKTPSPCTMNTDTWRDLLGWCRNVAVVIKTHRMQRRLP